MAITFTWEDVAGALPSGWRCSADGPDWRAERAADGAEVTAVRGLDLVSKALTWERTHPAAAPAPVAAPERAPARVPCVCVIDADVVDAVADDVERWMRAA